MGVSSSPVVPPRPLTGTLSLQELTAMPRRGGEAVSPLASHGALPAQEGQEPDTTDSRAIHPLTP